MSLECDDGYVGTRQCRAFPTIFRPTLCLKAQPFFLSPVLKIRFPHRRRDGFVQEGVKPTGELL